MERSAPPRGTHRAHPGRGPWARARGDRPAREVFFQSVTHMAPAAADSSPMVNDFKL